MFSAPKTGRITQGVLASTEKEDGNNGAFAVRLPGGAQIFCIASDGMGWEHVSVSKMDRCPTWEEMCRVKDAFWDPEDVVIQIHPPASDYVNNHPFCLHLWRKAGTNDFCELPPSIMVGTK